MGDAVPLGTKLLPAGGCTNVDVGREFGAAAFGAAGNGGTGAAGAVLARALAGVALAGGVLGAAATAGSGLGAAVFCAAGTSGAGADALATATCRSREFLKAPPRLETGGEAMRLRLAQHRSRRRGGRDHRRFLQWKQRTTR